MTKYSTLKKMESDPMDRLSPEERSRLEASVLQVNEMFARLSSEVVVCDSPIPIEVVLGEINENRRGLLSRIWRFFHKSNG